MIVMGDPLLRFLWIVATLFLIFYGISASGSLAAWTRFGYMAVITIPLWDRHIGAQAKVNGLLWAIGILTMAGLIALLLEMGYAAVRRGDDVMDPIMEHLDRVEQLLRFYADGRPVDAATHSRVMRLAMLGTSRLRRLILTRSHNGAQYIQQMGALAALTGRLVDLAANLPRFATHVAGVDHDRIDQVANRIAQIRHDLENKTVPRAADLGKIDAWQGLPLLGEIEKAVALIPGVFSDSQSLRIFDPSAPGDGDTQPAATRSTWFSSEHLKFGLKGCLAASICYIIYSALFWPEISTSLTTCLLTALTTIGASRQKQVLRFAGALIGGFVFGMGAQVFILPYIDSIAAFVILFLAVTTAAAWVTTSSPRLSYCGVQIAFAFFLINLQEFKIQTSLTVARDRVAGILLGLFVMWLVFDQLWSTPAGLAMKKAFVSGLRLLAQFTREPVSGDLRTAIERSYSLRETINAQFDKVRSLADGVLFEFGPARQRDLELRGFIRSFQPKLRALFLMRVASWKYRAQVPGFEFPENIRVRQAAYDERSADILEEMANRIEGQRLDMAGGLEDSTDLLEQTIGKAEAEQSLGLPAGQAQSFTTLLRGIDGLTVSLASEVAVEFGSSPL
jgi:multidrug resistance protein MdtO